LRDPQIYWGQPKWCGQAPLFSIDTFATLKIQPTTVVHLVTTLCESGPRTLDVVVKSKNTYALPIVPHPNFEANHPVATLALVRDQGKGVASVRAYK